MAIFKKNKKKNNPSPKSPTSSGKSQVATAESPKDNRHTLSSNSTTSNGPYDKHPQGVAPETFGGPLGPKTSGGQAPAKGSNGQRSANGGNPASNGVKSPVPGSMSSSAFPNRSISQSQYPWSQHFISNASPFPRYGHASNCIAARDGEVFVMGGLKGSNVFGDLWVIETGRCS